MIRSALFVLLVLPALAQWPFGGFPRRLARTEPAASVSGGKAYLEPATVVVGQPCHIVVALEVPKDAGVEDLRVGGLPDSAEGAVVYGEGFENLPDAPASATNAVLKRMRLPVRFLAPCRTSVALSVQGMVATRRQLGNSSFTSSHSFGLRLPPFTCVVEELPAARRPAQFSGAVGTRFRITQRLQPDRVRPGDLVTATYELRHDGYCPTNVFPTIEHLDRAFKAYEPKEVARTDQTVKWTQMLVPRTATATNAADVSFTYYNVYTKRYEVVYAPARKLTFVSTEAASTRNTAVVVDDAAARAGKGAPAAASVLTLRFAPSDASPAVVALPGGTPARETARRDGWRRLETARGAGWTR